MKISKKTRDLVFIGGGHTHALVLRMSAMKPIENVQVTVISDATDVPYSGMLPGYLSGAYTYDETHIDIRASIRKMPFSIKLLIFYPKLEVGICDLKSIFS